MPENVAIRVATPADCLVLAELIRELARYEKLEHEVRADAQTLKESLFGAKPRAHALLAESGGEVAGFCLYFYNFSTFLGASGIYIEDIFVREAYRGHGIGRLFFARLGEIAIQEKCGRIEWWVLDWNTPAQEFYRRLGAEPMSEWTVWRLTRDKFG
jgi:GNAT superfamily N-acetyltransferase